MRKKEVEALLWLALSLFLALVFELSIKVSQKFLSKQFGTIVRKLGTFYHEQITEAFNFPNFMGTGIEPGLPIDQYFPMFIVKKFWLDTTIAFNPCTKMDF